MSMSVVVKIIYKGIMLGLYRVLIKGPLSFT